MISTSNTMLKLAALPVARSSSRRFALVLIAIFFGSTSASMGANVIVNGSFESPAIPGTTVSLINAGSVPGWDTTAANNLIEIWSNGFGSVVSADGVQHAELNATQVSTLYQDVSGIPANATVGYSFAHRGRQGFDTLALQISDLGTDNAAGGVGSAADTLLFNQQYTTGNTAWVQYSAPTISNLTLGNDMRFAFVSISAAGGNQAIGNFLDNVSFGVGVSGVVPEPATCTLLCVGLAGAMSTRRRSRTRN
jgi:hypothetical protein